MNFRTRVAVVALENPWNFSTFSGISQAILKALASSGFDAVAVSRPTLYRKLHRMSGFIQRTRLEGALIESSNFRTVLAAPIVRDIRESESSVVIYLNRLLLSTRRSPPVPAALWIDHSVRQMFNYYPGYRNIPVPWQRRMLEAESDAFKAATVVCFASKWAMEDARNAYPEFESKFHVVPFGPNIVPTETRGGSCVGASVQVLTVAADWQRKGVDKLFAACEELRVEFPSLTLVGVGNTPPNYIVSQSWVHWYPNLKLEDENSQELMRSLFQKSRVFALISKAECFGIAAVEAGVFGLPLVVTRTGGLPEAARESGSPHVVFSSIDISELKDSIRRALDTQRDGERWDSHGDRRSWESRVGEVLVCLKESNA